MKICILQHTFVTFQQLSRLFLSDFLNRFEKMYSKNKYLNTFRMLLCKYYKVKTTHSGIYAMFKVLMHLSTYFSLRCMRILSPLFET